MTAVTSSVRLPRSFDSNSTFTLSAMTRFSFYTLLALASAGLALASSQVPLQGSLLSDKWKWTDCGKG